MAKGCALSIGYLPRGGLPRNSVDRITDHPAMTSAVDRGCKASTQTNKQKLLFCEKIVYMMMKEVEFCSNCIVLAVESIHLPVLTE